VTADLFNPTPGGGPQGPQWRPDDGRYDLVTFSFGGNDVGFVSVIYDCLGLDAVSSFAGPVWARKNLTCDFTEEEVRDRVRRLGSPDDPLCVLPGVLGFEPPEVADCGEADARRMEPLPALFDHLAADVVNPGGWVVVVGYPLPFANPDSESWLERKTSSCAGVWLDDFKLIRSLVSSLNSRLAELVREADEARPNGVRYRFVDIQSATDLPDDLARSSLYGRGSHDICGDKPWLNGITTGAGDVVPDLDDLRRNYRNLVDGLAGRSGTGESDDPTEIRMKRSFHPNQHGHDAVGRLITHELLRLDWRGLAEPLPPPVSEDEVAAAELPFSVGIYNLLEPCRAYWDDNDPAQFGYSPDTNTLQIDTDSIVLADVDGDTVNDGLARFTCPSSTGIPPNGLLALLAADRTLVGNDSSELAAANAEATGDSRTILGTTIALVPEGEADAGLIGVPVGAYLPPDPNAGPSGEARALFALRDGTLHLDSYTLLSPSPPPLTGGPFDHVDCDLPATTPEIAAQCFYRSYTAGDQAAASPFASWGVFDSLGPWQPPEWEWTGCEASDTGYASACWMFIEDDFHGVGVEMMMNRSEDTYYVAQIEFYG
jgi:hypothetical protein